MREGRRELWLCRSLEKVSIFGVWGTTTEEQTARVSDKDDLVSLAIIIDEIAYCEEISISEKQEARASSL